MAYGSVDWIIGKKNPKTKTMRLHFRYSILEDGSLRIHSAHVSDMGRYVCMATNTAGTERKRIDLQVLGKSFGFR